MAVLQLGIAVNDRRKNQQSGEWEDVPNFFDAVVFGQRGESLSRFLSKGSKVAIEGKLRWRQWETPEGDKRSKVEIIVDDIEFMSGQSGGGSQSQHGGGGGGGGLFGGDGGSAAIDEDIPF